MAKKSRRQKKIAASQQQEKEAEDLWNRIGHLSLDENHCDHGLDLRQNVRPEVAFFMKHIHDNGFTDYAERAPDAPTTDYFHKFGTFLQESCLSGDLSSSMFSKWHCRCGANGQCFRLLGS